MRDQLISPDEAPSAALAWIRSYRLQHGASRGPCPVGIRKLTPAEWAEDRHTDGLIVEIRCGRQENAP